jgi:hypothetical protein
MLGIGLFHELQVPDKAMYPEETVIGGFLNPDGAEQVLSALVKDFGRLNVSVLFGPEGLRTLDPDGEHHGLLGRSYRAVEKAMTESRGLADEAATLRRGGYLVCVDVANEEQKDLAADTMRAHDANHVVHLGRAAIEHL